MSSPPTNPHQTTLDTLIAIGATLAQDIQHARQANEITPTQAAEAFERVARATRRTILLAAHLAKPAAATAASPPETTKPSAEATTKAARRELIRNVEDAITREPQLDPASKQALEAEFRERLDAPELAEDLATRPVAAILADILHDMHLGRLALTKTSNWRRRTPDAIRRLHARAAGHPDPGPEPEHASRPHDPPLSLPALHRLILGGATGTTAPPA